MDQFIIHPLLGKCKFIKRQLGGFVVENEKLHHILVNNTHKLIDEELLETKIGKLLYGTKN